MSPIFKPTRGGFYAAFLIRAVHEESSTTGELAAHYGLCHDAVIRTTRELASRGLIHASGFRARKGMGPRERIWHPGPGDGSMVNTRRIRVETATLVRIYDALQLPLTVAELKEEIGTHDNYSYGMIRWLMELRLIHVGDWRMTCRQIPMYQWGFKKSDARKVLWNTAEGWKLAGNRLRQRKEAMAMIHATARPFTKETHDRTHACPA